MWTLTLGVGFECLKIKIQTPVNIRTEGSYGLGSESLHIWESLGDTDSGASLGQYSSSTNRAQHLLTSSSESGSVKWAQQRQKSLAEAELEENI